MTQQGSDEAKTSVWSRHAGQWSRLGSPLRPSAEDIARYENVIGDWARMHGSPRVAVWGVTPEIVGMPMPDGTHLVAVDNNPKMLELFPPAVVRPGAFGICADWRRLPLRAGARDLVIGDGCFAMVDYPEGFRRLARTLCSVLSIDGVCAFRVYLQPEPREAIDDLVIDLRAGRLGSFHAFKLRAAMALQQSAERGIEVGHVYEWWAQSGIEAEALTALYGWPAEVIATIDAYRGRRDVYRFPTLAELRRAVGDLLEEVDCRYPGYELGERCPLIEMRPRKRN